MTAACITDPKLKEMKKAVILSKCLSQAMTMTEWGIQLKWPGTETGFLARVLCKLGLTTESRKLHFFIHLFQHSGAHGKDHTCQRPSQPLRPPKSFATTFPKHFSSWSYVKEPLTKDHPLSRLPLPEFLMVLNEGFCCTIYSSQEIKNMVLFLSCDKNGFYFFVSKFLFYMTSILFSDLQHGLMKLAHLYWATVLCLW